MSLGLGLCVKQASKWVMGNGYLYVSLNENAKPCVNGWWNVDDDAVFDSNPIAAAANCTDTAPDISAI